MPYLPGINPGTLLFGEVSSTVIVF